MVVGSNPTSRTKQEKNMAEMINNISKTSRTLFRTDKITEDGQLVIACGYTTDGKFGYFIIHEQQSPNNEFVYTKPIHFAEKKHERTYQEVLKKLKEAI